jgi:hypothetical protein
MRSTDTANLPRWRRQPGFFEIWFLVVFAPASQRAWWFRYTTFSSLRGECRATLWAAAFDAHAREPAIAVKSILPIARYDAGSPFAVRIGEAVLTNETARGAVTSPTHTIAWDMRFPPSAGEVRRLPWLLHHLPLPTRVAHANDGLSCTGTVTVDGVTHALADAPGVQKHIWGTRRVDELYWVYCRSFEEDREARLEATAARLRRQLAGRPAPHVTSLALRTRDGAHDLGGLVALTRNRVEVPDVGRLAFGGMSATASIRVKAWADPRALAAWDYRDPAGWDVHVAQSDVASCAVELRTRSHPFAAWGPARILTCRHAAAIEFHAPEPLAGVRYLGWDDEHG